MNVFAKEDARDSYYTAYAPTKGGELVLRNMIEMAESYPKFYMKRFADIRSWAENGMPQNTRIQPLTLPLHFLIDDKNRQPDQQIDSSDDQVPF